MQSFDREFSDWLDGFDRKRRWISRIAVALACIGAFVLAWFIAAYSHEKPVQKYAPAFNASPNNAKRNPGKCIVAESGVGTDGRPWVRVECGEKIQ